MARHLIQAELDDSTGFGPFVALRIVQQEAAHLPERLQRRVLIALIGGGREQPLAWDLLEMGLGDSIPRVFNLGVRGTKANELPIRRHGLCKLTLLKFAVGYPQLSKRGEAAIRILASHPPKSRLRVDAVVVAKGSQRVLVCLLGVASVRNGRCPGRCGEGSGAAEYKRHRDDRATHRRRRSSGARSRQTVRLLRQICRSQRRSGYHITMAKSPDRALSAFQRLLADAAAGGQAKVDALVALSQRTILVPTWTPGGDDFRPLVSSDGQNALPLFSSEDQLMEAARRFGWLSPSGDVPFREIGSRAAFRHALAHQLSFVVVDIAAEHALEVERTEIEPLLQSQNRSDSSGAFAGVGRISEMMLQKVRPSSIPAAPPTPAAVPTPPAASLPSAASMPGAETGRSSNLPPADLGGTLLNRTLGSFDGEPSEVILEAARTVLRNYPEVEWAGVLMVGRDGGPSKPTFGLRVDATFRTRVQELRTALMEAAERGGAAMDILLLDDPDLVRVARANATVFFPWKRRS